MMLAVVPGTRPGGGWLQLPKGLHLLLSDNLGWGRVWEGQGMGEGLEMEFPTRANSLALTKVHRRDLRTRSTGWAQIIIPRLMPAGPIFLLKFYLLMTYKQNLVFSPFDLRPLGIIFNL